MGFDGDMIRRTFSDEKEEESEESRLGEESLGPQFGDETFAQLERRGRGSEAWQAISVDVVLKPALS